MADSNASSQKKDIELGSRANESSDEMWNGDRKINVNRRASLIETASPSTNWVQEDGDDRNDVYRSGSYNSIDNPSIAQGSLTGHHPSLFEHFEDSKYDPVGNKKPSDFIRAADLIPRRLASSIDDDRSDVYRAVGSSYSMDNPSMGRRILKGHPSRFKSFEDSKFDPVGIQKTSDFMRTSQPNLMSLSVASRPMQKTKKKDKVAHVVVEPALLKNMQIKKMSTVYNRCNSIVLLIAAGRKSEEYVRETVAFIYTKMNKLPHLTFKQNKKELKFKGSYYYAYEVCYFDATVWKVEQKKWAKSGMAEYIIEFRRRSLTGHGAFEQIFRRVAGWLFEGKRAKKYGNGFEIYPYEEPSLDIGDGVNDEIFDSPLPSSVEEATESDSSCQIRLENGLICSWAKIIHERSTYSEENIRILAICTKDRDNRVLMAEESKLHEALCEELNDSRNPSSCANALIIIKAIFEYDAETVADSFVKCGMLLSVTRCLLQHSNYKSRGSLRSVAIERVSLKILKKLTECQELLFAQQELAKVLKKLVKYQGHCTDGLEKGDLTDIIKRLKEKIHE